MEKEYKSKWNRYIIGNINWINSNTEHLCKKKFIKYICENKISPILEIGAGEVVEGRKIKELNPEISYNVLDISETFLEHCRGIDGIFAFEGDMISPPFPNKEFELVYASAVLEHSPNIRTTIKEISRISNQFYFNFFKWADGEGGLESRYYPNKKYFSTYFNIDMLMEFISQYGKIEDTFISFNKTDNYMDFDEYRKSNNIVVHRNGDYLTLRGIWNNE